MSTDSPELSRAGGNGLRERPFGRTSLAHRSDALFTSRNRGQQQQGAPAAAVQDEPHFITDSLNTSFASPSPARPTRIGKPRFATGNARTAAMTSARLVEPRDSRINSTSPARGPQKHALLRTSTSDKPLLSSASRSPARGVRNGTRTPSPRGRYAEQLISPVSNASDASPPRGLAESYRRIQDEELIAGQEGSGSEDGLHPADSQVLRDLVNGELPGHLRSPTPSSRRGSRRPTPQPELEGPGSNKGTPPRSHPPAAGDSRHSSPFEEVTKEEQDMLQSLSQHERDQQRVNAALDSNAQPFRKARKGTRLGSGLETLVNNDAASQSESASAGSRNSSQATDPSLNVPSGWGRKARANKSWLDRVKGDERSTRKQTDQAGSIEREKQASVAKWAEKAGEEVMDTIESDSFKPDDTEDIARTLDLQPPATASVPSTQPETVRLAFSKSKKSKIDALREREAGAKQTDKPAKPAKGAGKIHEESKSTPQISHKRKLGSNEPIGLIAPTASKPADGNSQAVQPKDQSRDLLRNLARATSASPSPELSAKVVEADQDPKPDTKPSGWFGGVARMFAKEGENAPAQPATQPKVADTPQISKSKLDAKTPMVTGAWIDTPATKAATEKRTLGPAPKVKTEPASTAESAPEVQSSLIPEKTKESITKTSLTVAELQETAPQLRTALADIVAKAKSDRAKRAEGIEVDETLQLDDSTIESLEELLASSDSSFNAPTSSLASVETPEATGNFPDKTIKQNQKEKKSRDSEQAVSKSYANLASRLTHLKTSITDAKEGVGSLQKHLSKSKDRQALVQPHECSEGGELHDFIVPCEQCRANARLASDVPFIKWQTVRVPVPRLLHYEEGARLPTPTRTGWITFTVLGLLLAEATAMYIFKPPFYATAESFIGWNPDIPKPPFVLAQLFWKRMLGPFLQPIVGALFVGIRALCAMMDIEPGPFGHSEDGRSSLYDRMFESLRVGQIAAEGWRNYKRPTPEQRAASHQSLMQYLARAEASQASAYSASVMGEAATVAATTLAAAMTAAAMSTKTAAAAIETATHGNGGGGGGGGWFGGKAGDSSAERKKVGGGWFGGGSSTKASTTAPAPARAPAGNDDALGMDDDEYL